ncbi:MAG: hypothetical protein E7160_04115 [Firmicutes bacterium]|nr:hypothetical protein [Bacillota bacterium]
MKKKTKVIVILIILLIIIVSLLVSFFFWKKDKDYKEMLLREKELVNSIKDRYSDHVEVTKDSKIYKLDNNKYVEVGMVYKNSILDLEKEKIDKNTKYFKIKDLNYYIDFNNLKESSAKKVNDRYKSYLPFNLNIVTADKVNLYQDDNKIYTLNYSLDLPVIVKSEVGSYVEFNNELYLIKNEDIKNTYDKVNTEARETLEVPVTVYHFIYLEGDTSCNEIICHHESQIRSHFKYLSENKFFTITTKEMEWFIDKKVRLPEKSVLVTIDDGARAEKFIPLLEEYKVHATLFLVTSWYPTDKFKSEYLELQSHTDNLHEGGKCPGGQGSGLKCLDRNTLLTDLKASRDKLGGADAFCYPFYEFNDYSESILKEVGFKTAYIGGMQKVKQGINKYRIPRITIMGDNTLDEYVKYVN